MFEIQAVMLTAMIFTGIGKIPRRGNPYSSKLLPGIGRNIGTPDCIPRPTVSDIGGNYESGNSGQIIPFI